MADVTVKIQNTTKPEKRFLAATLAQANAERAAQNPPLEPFADNEAKWAAFLANEILLGGKDYDKAQGEANADIKALISAWPDLTPAQQNAVKTAAGI